MSNDLEFKKSYTRLNKEQKKAVDTIDGPVMVIAGPGTGKTEILTLRIANILQKTDTPASGILALTFTNSGVRAMRERLTRMIGNDASGVTISTFHSFGISLIQEFYEELSFNAPPTLLDDRDRVILFDELLENNDWQYLRLRSGGVHSFDDLKSVIQLLKQERMPPVELLKEIDGEVQSIQNNPENISSRGPSKGQLKAIEQEKIERFERTREIARFYELYEQTKKGRNVIDYDDVLEYIVKLVQKSEDARSTLQERYLYILIDEHQDSSGVQNEFVEEVWAGVEKPNVFVVGDDRQLIYGFGGASLSHFERFKEIFSETELIALIDNHRSTQDILNLADTLLQSSLVKAQLKSIRKESEPVYLVEAQYPRDEIIRAGIEIQEKIKAGISPNECAILVPKKAQVKSALTILRDLGLPVAQGDKASFFLLSNTRSLINLLHAALEPYTSRYLGQLVLDPIFNIPFLSSQKFLHEFGYKLSLDSFGRGDSEIQFLGELITRLSGEVPKHNIYEFVQYVGEELFFKNPTNHKELLVQIEVVRTMLHLALQSIEKNPKVTLAEFLVFLQRLETYGQDIPLAVFSGNEGVNVMTLHASKGLEFDFVWIAHLDESSLMKGKQLTVTLPTILKEKVSKKDEITARRELYVGITRAKRFCTLSYARTSYSGGDQYLAKIISEIPSNLFIKKTAEETEKEINNQNKMSYVLSRPLMETMKVTDQMVDLVKEHYADRPVSVTHLNNFFSCPWKWYFRNFLSLPEPLTESLEFGNLMHTSIETLLKEKVVELTKISEILESGLDFLRIYDDRKRSRFTKDGRVVLERFLKEYSQQFRGALSEKKVSNYRDPEIPDIDVGGKIDVVETLTDGTLSVTDFKTGRIKTPREIEKIKEDGRMGDLLRQLATYSYLLSNGKEGARVSISQLLFLEAEEGDKNALYRTSINSSHIDLLRTDLKDYSKLLQTGKWLELPCDFKPTGTQKYCQYCEMVNNLN